ncbi:MULTISPECIES: WXG100 family type VII secretion target [Clostridiaceae]|uniref:WXG100 family type VII secretion target n=1 Tax=Clostridiaceae TaxID=31979 RepID=UPI0005500BEE|nr:MULTISPECIES: WXG100 family type VII secretion target [Clostridiaceae]
MSQIRITPQELYDGSNKIKGIANSIMQDLKTLKSTVDQVANNWEGAAQSSYVQSFEQIYSEFVKTFPPTVEGLANQMNGAAENLEQTDAELAKIFSSK